MELQIPRTPWRPFEITSDPEPLTEEFAEPELCPADSTLSDQEFLELVWLAEARAHTDTSAD